MSKAITAQEKTGGSQPKNLRQVRMGDDYKPTGQDAPNGDTYDAKKLGREDDGRQTCLTDAAKQWQGWGTALKPAHEPIVVARKPLNGTVAANVLAHGTGAINIDGCRVGSAGGCKDAGPTGGNDKSVTAFGDGLNGHVSAPVQGLGRWPANIVFTHAAGCGESCQPGCPVAELDAQSGKVGAAAPASGPTYSGPSKSGSMAGAFNGNGDNPPAFHNDTGGASRFFTVTEWDPAADAPFRYVAKPAKKERNAGLDGLPIKRPDTRTETGMGTFDEKGVQPQRNFHPTVKPVALMRWLIRLVTPPNGIVLDPFLGSGTTAVAAILEGFDWRGCEMTADYLPIIEGRVAWATNETSKPKSKTRSRKAKAVALPETEQLELFPD